MFFIMPMACLYTSRIYVVFAGISSDSAVTVVICLEFSLGRLREGIPINLKGRKEVSKVFSCRLVYLFCKK